MILTFSDIKIEGYICAIPDRVTRVVGGVSQLKITR